MIFRMGLFMKESSINKMNFKVINDLLKETESFIFQAAKYFTADVGKTTNFMGLESSITLKIKNI